MKKSTIVFVICTIALIHTTHITAQLQNSVLASGNWYKIAIATDGIYKLSYSDLVNLGVNLSGADPKKIKLYGNASGMLPEKNSVSRPDDLIENAIFINGENDGVFDPTDYVVFYGQGKSKWHVDQSGTFFNHETNLYTDTSYYFLTVGLTDGKRIQTIDNSTLTTSDTVKSFSEHWLHEKDSISLIRSGKQWYGEFFNPGETKTFNIPFTDIDFTIPFHVEVDLAARNNVASQLNIDCGSLSSILTPPTVPTDLYYGQYASAVNGILEGINGGSNSLQIKNVTAGNQAWLNYIEANFRRKLIKNSDQLFFRDLASVKKQIPVTYKIGNASPTDIVWDITNAYNIKAVKAFVQNTDLQFNYAADSLKEFVLFNSTYLIPVLKGQLANQNLHGASSADLIIVCAPDFISQANNLAAFHNTNDGLSFIVATTEQVYNEFSSGSKDVEAIRDFLRYVYKKNPGQLKYVTLLGDCSFDPKNHLGKGGDWVPCFETAESFDPTASSMSDNFYGVLGDNGFNFSTFSSADTIGIGVGRLPVNSISQASDIVNKIINYNSHSTFGNWRNSSMFIADDADNDIHESQADYIANLTDNIFCDNMNEKIFLDHFVEVTDSTGQHYPTAKTYINKRIEDGILSVLFMGPGGTGGFAREKVFDQNDVSLLTNAGLPFICANSNMAQLDNPDYVSILENMVLKPNGGAIAALAPNRLVYSNPGFTFNMTLFENLWKKNSAGLYPRLGDAIMSVKIPMLSGNFIGCSLIGDPALRLAYPANSVYASKINGIDITQVDFTTLVATNYTIDGVVADPSGKVMSGFNGKLDYVVFDDQKNDTTLSNDGQIVSPRFIYKQWEDTISKGTVNVNNGQFTINFNTSGSTNSKFKKINFYMTDSITDGTGCYIWGSKDILAGISKIDQQEQIFSLYPNPAHNTITISSVSSNSGKNDLLFELYNVIGQNLLSQQLTQSGKNEISINEFAPGIYMYRITNNDGIVKNGKLIIE